MVSPIVKMPNSEKQSGVSGIPTQLLVLHSGECPLRGGYAQSLTTWANVPLAQGGPEASWHWFVDPIAIVSMVDPQFAAWHASEANPMSEGFEQGGYARFTRAEWLTAEGAKQMDNLAWIMAQRAKANGIPAVWLTTDQVTAVTTYGNRTIKGFCLHRQIDPETRTDPGDGYPYDLLMAKVKAYMSGSNITTQSTSPTKPQGLFMTLTPAQEKTVLTRSENYLDAPVSKVDEAVWAVKVDRGAKSVSALQELADCKSMLLAQQGTLAGVLNAIQQLASKPGSPVDLAAVTAAAEAGAAAALADLTATVTIQQQS
ncbi:endolysin [Arthrobacter phage Shoya]|uniref:Lysin A n=1 Tax=Arthrobacter phage Shoya TaxID=2704035 RepID=A0A6G6XIT3_9CAUD|nr:endolysin [Arthrobacter phage Shoya]QIG57693.1 lysin A [Arthrobacter phage Shoya]